MQPFWIMHQGAINVSQTFPVQNVFQNVLLDRCFKPTRIFLIIEDSMVCYGINPNNNLSKGRWWLPAVWECLVVY